ISPVRDTGIVDSDERRSFSFFSIQQMSFLSFLFLSIEQDRFPSFFISTLLSLQLFYQTFLPMPDGDRTVSPSLEATDGAGHSTNSGALMVSMWMMIKLSISLTMGITVLWNGRMVPRVIEWWPVEKDKEIEMIS